ncbi:Dimethyladenosine transferase, partial [Bienertia sinuspersici]
MSLVRRDDQFKMELHRSDTSSQDFADSLSLKPFFASEDQRRQQTMIFRRRKKHQRWRFMSKCARKRHGALPGSSSPCACVACRFSLSLSFLFLLFSTFYRQPYFDDCFSITPYQYEQPLKHIVPK